MLPNELRELLNDLDAAGVECDGMARLITTRLQEAGIEHRVMVGEISLNEQVMTPHFWVEVGDLTVDYRARMWLGDSILVPHGVFRQETCAVRYVGDSVEMDALTPQVFAILNTPPFNLKDMIGE